MNELPMSALRFRVWVDGTLADETVIDSLADDADELTDQVRARHLAITDQAEAAGRKWLVEVFDPEQPPDRAYVRMGTDAAGMVDPRPLEL